MRVAVAGASGMLGRRLVEALLARGDQVHPMVRARARARGDAIYWDPAAGDIDRDSLEGVDAVVNLAGENIGQRWTREARERIRSSRVDGTRLIAETIATLQRPPRVHVNPSGIGIYGSRGDEPLDDSSTFGKDFLADLGRRWEAATQPSAGAGARVAITRFGVVLSPDGGMLGRLLPIFRWGLGGRVGSGSQWISWVSIDDAVRAIERAIEDERWQGPVNVVAPTPVTNAEFTRVLGRVLRRPAVAVVPAVAVRLAFGSMGEHTVLASQRIIPTRLLALGFDFGYPEIEGALRHVLGREK